MADRPFTVIENQWIKLKDGTRLSARIWMPDGAETDPVPAVFEFLPYRKRDGTSQRDESTYPVFAAAGIAGVRVDIRGSGESDGIIDGEYTELELANACELIGWIAAQSWSNGAVGMMGISWGGFNSLQVAALRPPALKAVISIASTVDRYNDDIHYKNGCHLSAQLSWSATMLNNQSRPPDPALVGDAWREMWLARLEQEPFLMEEWLQHQRRDDFWRHGSICENFADIEVPVLIIAGWADGYRNAPLMAIEGLADKLGDKAKALIGPWIHKYPHFAWPKPRADFLGEAVAWWNRWLRGDKNGIEALPQLRAYMLDAVKPAPRRDVDPGFWVAMDRWQQPEMQSFHVGTDGSLASGAADTERPSRDIYVKSPLDTGTAAGEFFTVKPDAELAADQRYDDAGSLCFETDLLTDSADFLGRPIVTVTVTAKAALANLCARLVDVHPDGTATRVSFGVLNLAHRDGNAEPKPMKPGERTKIRLVLDACGYRFAKGHRIRLSISTSYWPMILPPPMDEGLLVDAASLRFDLPKLGGHLGISMKQPDNPNPLPQYIERQPSATKRQVVRDLSTNRTDYVIHEDSGLFQHPGTGMSIRQTRNDHWSIALDDPVSMTGVSAWTCYLERSNWSVRTESVATISCTARDWVIKASVTGYEDNEKVAEKRFEKVIPRDQM